MKLFQNLLLVLIIVILVVACEKRFFLPNNLEKTTPTKLDAISRLRMTPPASSRTAGSLHLSANHSFITVGICVAHRSCLESTSQVENLNKSIRSQNANFRMAYR
jgi:hypothetical protein